MPALRSFLGAAPQPSAGGLSEMQKAGLGQAEGKMITAEEKERRAAYKADWQRKFRKSHPEIIALRSKKHREANRDKTRADDRSRYDKNREKEIARSRVYCQLHKEELATKRHAYYRLHRDRFIAYHKANRERAKDLNLRKKYGICLKDFNALLEKQRGSCAICSSSNWHGRQACVDHDHVTGKVRGLLCHKCNLAIGLLGDNLALAESLVEYLKQGA
jgi:hypothetical protein